jgi:hypothetical protein
LTAGSILVLVSKASLLEETVHSFFFHPNSWTSSMELCRVDLYTKIPTVLRTNIMPELQNSDVPSSCWALFGNLMFIVVKLCWMLAMWQYHCFQKVPFRCCHFHPGYRNGRGGALQGIYYSVALSY